MAAVVEFKNYSMGFKDDDGQVFNLLDQVSFQVVPGKALGIVGESGCGKSMTSLSMMRLLPSAAVVQGGEILFEGKNLLAMSDEEMSKIRGEKASIIFQEPMTALNPVLTIGKQIGEAIQLHHPEVSREEIQKRVIQALEEVGIPNPETRIHQYPHEFSGGMRQRVMIAMAMINHPALLIADEPTTALDVTVQAQILDLMKRLKGTGGLVMVTHNLGVVAEICEEVVVMYAGRAVERGTLKEVFDHPLHPYTKGLMASIPTMSSGKEPLHTIPGTVPTVYDFGPGCRFADRCEHCTQRCRQQSPPEKQVGEEHLVQCWLSFEGEENADA
ncbi:ABC transporter ATP-binding protein [Angelakisella massiliensis]|uniref:ABC transporter ATP-binding protein n=1 Tax=Angelakisella massiliensis TaxID=1871018 RepID=UPI0008F7E86D|nr:ABC transporter ATP-binding protein [Angelakisella massiliensis]